jgi:hypothetical protein
MRILSAILAFCSRRIVCGGVPLIASVWLMYGYWSLYPKVLLFAMDIGNKPGFEKIDHGFPIGVFGVVITAACAILAASLIGNRRGEKLWTTTVAGLWLCAGRWILASFRLVMWVISTGIVSFGHSQL